MGESLLVRGRYGSVDRKHLVAYALAAFAVALLAVGFLSVGSCGGGLALVLFGAAVGVMGGVIALLGGHVMVLPAAVVLVTLVWAGTVVAGQTGCGW